MYRPTQIVSTTKKAAGCPAAFQMRSVAEAQEYDDQDDDPEKIILTFE